MSSKNINGPKWPGPDEIIEYSELDWVGRRRIHGKMRCGDGKILDTWVEQLPDPVIFDGCWTTTTGVVETFAPKS